MNNYALRRRVKGMLARNAGIDAILAVVSDAIVFHRCHQLIVDRFCEEHSLPEVTATKAGRDFLFKVIEDTTFGNRDDFEMMYKLHEALEDDSLWLLTPREAQRYRRLTQLRQDGGMFTTMQEGSYQRLHARFVKAGVVPIQWVADGDAKDGRAILLLPKQAVGAEMGVSIGKNVPADLKERIRDAVLELTQAV